jgi:hypothetical protein
MIYAVYYAIDLAVTKAVAGIKNGYISWSCVVTNYGKQNINEFEVTAGYNNGQVIREKWTGQLLAGQSVSYTFKAKTKVAGDDTVKFYCIGVELPEGASQPDENPANNSLCNNYQTDFWVGKPYPNPVVSGLSIDIILSYSQIVELKITDINGRIVKTFTINGKKGLNRITIPVTTLNQGNYSLIITGKEGVEVRKFMK